MYVFALGLAVYESNAAYRAAFKRFYGIDPTMRTRRGHAAPAVFLEYGA